MMIKFRERKKTAKTLFLLSLTLLTVCFALFRITYSGRRIPILIACLLLSSAAYSYTAFYLGNQNRHVNRVILFVIIIAAISMRFSLFTVEPEVLSDDVYRYLWDGKVQTEGFNPYLNGPSSEQLTTLHDSSLYAKVAHKGSTTSYPPLSELIFLTAYRIGGDSLLGLRLIYLLTEVGIVCFLYLTVANKRHILIYLLCPLIIVEVYAGMHIDIISAFFLTAAYYFFTEKKYYPFLIFLTASVLIKYLSLILLPIFLIAYIRSEKANTDRGSLVLDLGIKCIIALSFSFLLFLPYIDAGGNLFSQLRNYLVFWRFNGSFYYLTEVLFGEDTAWWSRILLLSMILGYLSLHKRIELHDKIIAAIMVFFLLAPTVYPWYLIPIVPFFALRLRKSEFFFVSIVFLSYYVLIGYKNTGVWKENPIFILVEYIPLYILFLHDFFRGVYVQESESGGDLTGAQ